MRLLSRWRWVPLIGASLLAGAPGGGAGATARADSNPAPLSPIEVQAAYHRSADCQPYAAQSSAGYAQGNSGDRYYFAIQMTDPHGKVSVLNEDKRACTEYTHPQQQACCMEGYRHGRGDLARLILELRSHPSQRIEGRVQACFDDFEQGRTAAAAQCEQRRRALNPAASGETTSCPLPLRPKLVQATGCLDMGFMIAKNDCDPDAAGDRHFQDMLARGGISDVEHAASGKSPNLLDGGNNTPTSSGGAYAPTHITPTY